MSPVVLTSFLPFVAGIQRGTTGRNFSAMGQHDVSLCFEVLVSCCFYHLPSQYDIENKLTFIFKVKKLTYIGKTTIPFIVTYRMLRSQRKSVGRLSGNIGLSWRPA